MKRIVVALIRLYQKTFTARYIIQKNLHIPYHPCRFEPSCSEYTLLSVQKHGVIKGLKMGFAQILKCNGF